MIKLLIERDLPANFDVTDDAQAARHARIALDAIVATQGKMHWLCTYATDDRKLFGLVVVESEEVIDAYVRNAGIGSSVRIHRVLRTLDPALAAPQLKHDEIRLRWNGVESSPLPRERSICVANRVRGYGLSKGQEPSPGASRRPLPDGER
jgi:hypothetical protein